MLIPKFASFLTVYLFCLPTKREKFSPHMNQILTLTFVKYQQNEIIFNIKKSNLIDY